VKIINLLLILTIASLFPSKGWSEAPVRIAIGEWTPYLSQNLKHYGVASHIVTEAFKEEGLEVQIRFYPWKRVHLVVKKGKEEASILWVWTEERAKDFHFTDVMIAGDAVFFHLKKTSFDWKTYEDLEGIKMGGLASASYPWAQKAQEQGIHLKINRVGSEKQNFGMLLLGRITVYSMDRLVGYNVLRTYFSPQEVKQFTYHSRPIDTWPYRLIFSKKVERSPHLVALFNKGLQRLKAKNKIKQYLSDAEQGKYSK